jgi:hypothetical protein
MAIRAGLHDLDAFSAVLCTSIASAFAVFHAAHVSAHIGALSASLITLPARFDACLDRL